MSLCSSKKGHKDDCCFSCCHEKHLVQDQLCCEFSVTGSTVGTASVIYATDASVSCGKLVASGTIKNCSPTIALVVQFLRGTTVIRELTVPAGGCLAFTLTGFDAIRVFGAAAVATPFNGEICITPRYTL